MLHGRVDEVHEAHPNLRLLVQLHIEFRCQLVGLCPLPFVSPLPLSPPFLLLHLPAIALPVLKGGLGGSGMLLHYLGLVVKVFILFLDAVTESGDRLKFVHCRKGPLGW